MSANLNTKVFVGNLSYKTSKQDLASHFSSVGGVVNANIISRGNRSMGYGFVEFDSEAAAQKAISVLNHQSIDGREINVELAKPREEGEPAADRGVPRGRGRGGRGRGALRGTFQPRGGGVPGRGLFRGAPRGGAPPAAAPVAPAEAPSQNGAPTNSPPRARGGSRGRGLGPRGGPGGPAGGVPLRARGGYPGYFARGGGGSFRGRGGAPRRPIRADRGQRESSNTTLYVNNLPFKLEDNDLKEIFKEYKVVSAHVVANKYNGRKKGYGFVELENQDEQNKALTLNNLVVEGRKIGVRVAFKEVKKEETGEKTAEETTEKKEVKKEGENK